MTNGRRFRVNNVAMSLQVHKDVVTELFLAGDWEDAAVFIGIWQIYMHVFDES